MSDSNDDAPESDAPDPDSPDPAAAVTPASIGETVYDSDGNALGSVRGYDDNGFYVTTAEGIDALSVEHERAGHEFGMAELMWRCTNCGEMGSVQDIPDSCPNCGAAREELYYWTED